MNGDASPYRSINRLCLTLSFVVAAASAATVLWMNRTIHEEREWAAIFLKQAASAFLTSFIYEFQVIQASVAQVVAGPTFELISDMADIEREFRNSTRFPELVSGSVVLFRRNGQFEAISSFGESKEEEAQYLERSITEFVDRYSNEERPILSVEGAKQAVFLSFPNSSRAGRELFVGLQLDRDVIDSRVVPQLAYESYGRSGKWIVELVERNDDVDEQKWDSLFPLFLETSFFDHMQIYRNTQSWLENPDIRSFNYGYWLIGVRHVSGSINSYVAGIRNGNIAIGAGLYLMLQFMLIFVYGIEKRRIKQDAREHEFIGLLSHELKTPLTIINFMSDNLERGIVHSRETIHEYGKSLREEGQKLSRMIINMLHLNHLSSNEGESPDEIVSVAEVIGDVVRDLDRLKIEHDARIDITFDVERPIVVGDPVLLNAAIHNLIANALIHGKPVNGNPHEIKILVRTDYRKKRLISIVVRDSGPGIPLRSRQEVFRPFYRGNGVASGSGIGLSLAARVAMRHHATLRLSSELGSGSEFCLSIPSAGGTHE